MEAFSTLEIRLIGALVALVGVIGLLAYFEHRGAEKCIAANNVKVAQQTAHKATVEAVDVVLVQQEKKTYDETVDRPLVRPISLSLCDTTPAVVPTAATARPEPHAAPASPAVHREAAVPGATLGPGLQMTGKQADAQIVALQAYIRDVCLKR
jgi:hypothetical protein